nr:MAG TPA: hypothetical protein [Caudoviricetes sp.]
MGDGERDLARGLRPADLCDGAAPLRSNLAWRTLWDLRRRSLERFAVFACLALRFPALTPHHPKGT